MPRDGSHTYVLPFPDVVEDTTIESTVYNGFTHDVAQDLNAPRPISAGGTGANNAADAMIALSGEIAKQVVTNYDSHMWASGSFYSAGSATNPPVAGHAFSGIVYMADANNIVVEARDSTDGKLYIRRKVAGVWGAWAADTGSIETELAAIEADIAALETDKVAKAGDTMTGLLTLSGDAVNPLNPVTKQQLDAGDGKYVRYDAAQTLTSAQASRARANINVLKRNYIINGGMQISQENGTTAGTIVSVLWYPVDMFVCSATTAGNANGQQVASLTPGGSPNRLQIQVGAVDATVGATDLAFIDHNIEGLRVADLMFGTASAKTVTLQFGVRAPAGTYCVTLLNGAKNRSYVSEYVIAAGEANTDVIKSITVAGDQAGTWLKDNGTGLIVRWGLMVGANYQQAAGSWGAGNVAGTVNHFNLLSGGNTLHLFDVSLTEGTSAPPFQLPDYASELALCQYYWRKTNSAVGIAYSTTTARFEVSHPAMRATPTPTVSGAMIITDVYAGNYTQSAGAVTITGGNADGGQYDLPNFTGLTSGRVYIILASPTLAIKLNARL